MPFRELKMLFRLVIGAVAQARAAKDRSEIPRERDRGDRGTLARAHAHARDGHTTANDSAASLVMVHSLPLARAETLLCPAWVQLVGAACIGWRPIASAT